MLSARGDPGVGTGGILVGLRDQEGGISVGKLVGLVYI